MAAIAFAHYEVVRLLVGSAGQLIQGGNPYSVMQSIEPSVERLRDSELNVPLRPLLELVPRDGSFTPTREAVANAIQEASANLGSVVTDFERSLLEAASERLTLIVGKPRGKTSSSGVFPRQAAGTVEEGRRELDRQMREAVFISIGGALHDANNTLMVLQGAVSLARRQRPEVLQLAIGDATVEATLNEVEAQTNTILQMVRDLRAQIDSMREVVPETANDLRNLLLSGGYVDRIFSRLAKVRLFLGRVQKRMSTSREPISDEAREACWRLFESIGHCIEFTKLTASLFRGLLDIQQLYDESESSHAANVHAHLRAGMIQAVLGRGVKLTIDLESDPWDVKGPSRAIWQVIINLVGNARQAMEEFGSLEIVTRQVHLSEDDALELSHHYLSSDPRAGDYMKLSIQDTGPGIPSVAMPRIFELFVSGRSSSGYGLAVTRKLVEDMGGFIGVDSSTGVPRKGTTFSIYFPRLT